MTFTSPFWPRLLYLFRSRTSFDTYWVVVNELGLQPSFTKSCSICLLYPQKEQQINLIRRYRFWWTSFLSKVFSNTKMTTVTALSVCKSYSGCYMLQTLAVESRWNKNITSSYLDEKNNMFLLYQASNTLTTL